MVTPNGLETVPRADVDIPSGVMKVPAPWDRLPEDHDPGPAEVDHSGGYPPYSPGTGVEPPRASYYSPGSNGLTPHRRLLHDKNYFVPEDDPKLVPATQRRPVELPKKMDGTYNPITHQWAVPPSDVREMDREALPPGMRGKLGYFRK